MNPLAKIREKLMSPSPKGRDDLEFLPSALEVLETPPAPAGRITIWVLVIFFSLFVLWSVFSKVDVVAVGHGKIIPSGKVKTIQPLESGIVRAIHVKDGQHVNAGDVLIELDATVSEAEIAATRQQIQKLEETLPLLTQKAKGLKELSAQGLVARNDYAEAEEKRIAMQKDLEVAKAELKKATEHGSWQKLTAPTSGIAQQLAIHTVGGVVTPAQALLTIVPEGEQLEVEAFIENKDIGFVWAGQPVALKVETFPFTKYGTIAGQLTTVSDDAIQDEKLGLIYAVKSSMAKSVMDVEGRKVNLTPGMSVTVEIQTGKRRLIEYFLAPLLKHGQESVRER